MTGVQTCALPICDSFGAVRGDGVSGRDELLQQAAAPEPKKKGEDAGGGDACVGYRVEGEGIER